MAVRWIRFMIAILIGAVLGALYGWLVNPVEYVDTTPDLLRVDYQSDYVLMVAETYQADQDLSLAAQRLALLGDDPPGEIVHQAILFAEPRYTDADVALMRSLSDALQTWIPALETEAP
jgi:hypothetical protein